MLINIINLYFKYLFLLSIEKATAKIYERYSSLIGGWREEFHKILTGFKNTKKFQKTKKSKNHLNNYTEKKIEIIIIIYILFKLAMKYKL